jgi:hypothetical protein
MSSMFRTPRAALPEQHLAGTQGAAPRAAPAPVSPPVYRVVSRENTFVDIPDTRDIPGFGCCAVPAIFGNQGGKASHFSETTLKLVQRTIEAARAGEKPPEFPMGDRVAFFQAAELLRMPMESTLEALKTSLTSTDAIWTLFDEALKAKDVNSERLLSIAIDAAFADFTAFVADSRFPKQTDPAYSTVRDLVLAGLEERVTRHGSVYLDPGRYYVGAEEALLWLIHAYGLEETEHFLPLPTIESAVANNLSKFLAWCLEHPAWQGQSPWPLARQIRMDHAAVAEELLQKDPDHATLQVLLRYVSKDVIKAWANKSDSSLISYARRGDLTTIKDLIVPNLVQDGFSRWFAAPSTPYTEAVTEAVRGAHHEMIRYFQGLARSQLLPAVRTSSSLQRALSEASDETWDVMFPPGGQGRHELFDSLDNKARCAWVKNVCGESSEVGYERVARIYKRFLDGPECKSDAHLGGLHYACFEDYIGFRAAVAVGDTKLAERILEEGRVVFATKAYQAEGYSAFYSAISRGHLHVLKWLQERSPEDFTALLKAEQHKALRVAGMDNQGHIVDVIAKEPAYPEAFRAAFKAENTDDVGKLFDTFYVVAAGKHTAMFERLFSMLDTAQQRAVLSMCGFELAQSAANSAGKSGLWPVVYRFVCDLGERDDMLRCRRATVLWNLAKEAPEQFTAVVEHAGATVLQPMLDESLPWNLPAVVKASDASSKVVETLLAHLRADQVVPVANKLFLEKVLQAKNDRAFIALMKALKIGSLRDLPDSVVEALQASPPTPGMRNYLSRFLPSEVNGNVSFTTLRDIAAYGDAARFREAVETKLRPLKRDEAALEADLAKHAESADPDLLAVISRRHERLINEREHLFTSMADWSLLTHAVHRGESDLFRTMIAIAPQGDDRDNNLTYDRLEERGGFEDALNAAVAGGHHELYELMLAALSHREREVYECTLGHENSLALLDAQIERRARDAGDRTALAKYAEAAWAAAPEDMEASRIRSLFVESRSYAVRAEIFRKHKRILADLVRSGDFTVMQRIEALNRDGAREDLERRRVQDAHLLGAALVLRTSMQDYAAEAAARQLLGLNLGPAL